MDYGHAPHISGPMDRTVIWCKHCGWQSPPMDAAQKARLGVPWWCGACTEQATHYVTYAPHEESTARQIVAEGVAWAQLLRSRDA